MLYTKILLLEWSTPTTCRLLLHHAVSNFFGSCSSELWITFLMKVSFCLATYFLMSVYKKISDKSSRLWLSLLSLVLLWLQVSSWCYGVVKIPVFSEVVSAGTRSRIPIVEDLWVWQGISIIFCRGQWMCPSKCDSMIPLIRRRSKWKHKLSFHSFVQGKNR